VIGVQVYHFNFLMNDGMLAATAIVQTGDEMRDVEFTDVKLDGDVVSFVELRQVQDREIRIDFRVGRYKGKIRSWPKTTRGSSRFSRSTRM
jgi:hypothetical protein